MYRRETKFSIKSKNNALEFLMKSEEDMNSSL